jgi:hypothetical protein
MKTCLRKVHSCFFTLAEQACGQGPEMRKGLRDYFLAAILIFRSCSTTKGPEFVEAAR